MRGRAARVPAAAGRLRVAYLVSRYPHLSHTFIEREVEGLRARGVEVETLSVRAPDEAGLLSEAMRSEAATTFVVLSDQVAVLRRVVTLGMRRPGALTNLVRVALTTGERGLRARLWQLFYLAEAVTVHREMCRGGLRQVHVHFSNNAADVARLVVTLGRSIDGPDSGWCWSMTVHGPTEFSDERHFDLAAKVRDADGVACISDFTRSQVMRLVERAEWSRLQIVHMSVDVDRFLPTATRSTTDSLRVLFVGRLVPEKGPSVLLDAVGLLASEGVEIDVRMVGGGPLVDTLADEVSRSGLGDRVQLLGPVGQDAIAEHFAWADTFCLPSFAEGLPVVLMEAMAAGVPPVTTRIAGIPELVLDGINGFVVSPGRPDLVADRLAQLARDPQMRATLGVRAREAVVEEFSVSSAARSQEHFLRSVTEEVRRG